MSTEPTDPQLAVLSHRVETMNETLNKLAEAVNKLALVEERQTQFAAAQERAFKFLERLDGRVGALELYVPANKRISIWVDRATWGAIGLIAMAVIKKSGVL